MSVAVITGASGGIGREISLLFAKKGYDVALCYNSSFEEARKTADEIVSGGGKALCLKCDVTKKEQTDIMAEKVLGEWGRIDVLVNNAGVSLQKLFGDCTQEDYDFIFDVNVKGVMNCTQSVLPDMIKRKSGSVVNISSMWGVSGGSCEVHYSASKSAVIGFTKALAKEVGLSGIRVNCVSPGMIDTKMNSCFSKEVFDEISEMTPLNRTGNAKEVANAVVFLAGDDASFITGQNLCVDGGLTV